MLKKAINIGLFWAIAILIIFAFTIPVYAPSASLNYTENITDPQGDVDAVNADNYSDDADIISLKTSENEGVITIELMVVGTIHTSVDGEYDSVRYKFFIDINPPELEESKRIADWMITIYKTYYQDMMFLTDNNGEHEYTLTTEDVTGGGTNTLTIKFPLEYITDDITGWDIKGDTEIEISGAILIYTSAEDNTGGSWSWTYGGSSGDGGDGWDGWDTPNPATETPTDTSIEVDITTTSWSYENRNSYLYIDITVKGTTNGVNHCKLLEITHFDDGSKDDDYDWMSRLDADNFNYGEMEFSYNHFKETSPEWKTWEYRIKGKTKITEETPTHRIPTKVDIYVRAFRDDGGQQWNQATKTAPVSVNTGSSDGSSDSRGFLPGFEIIITFTSITLVMIISRINLRKMSK